MSLDELTERITSIVEEEEVYKIYVRWLSQEKNFFGYRCALFYAKQHNAFNFSVWKVEENKMRTVDSHYRAVIDVSINALYFPNQNRFNLLLEK